MEFAFDYINTVEIVEPKELLNARGWGDIGTPNV